MEMLCNLIIRPPRAQYDPNRALPGPAIRIGTRTYKRTDLQARAFCLARASPLTRGCQLASPTGEKLECSHYTPDVWAQEARLCNAWLCTRGPLPDILFIGSPLRHLLARQQRLPRGRVRRRARAASAQHHRIHAGPERLWTV